MSGRILAGVLLSLTLLWAASAAHAQTPTLTPTLIPFEIDTKPGFTAVTYNADKEEVVATPLGKIISLLDKFVTMMTLFGSQEKQVIEFPDFEKQQTLHDAAKEPLMPLVLQSRLKEPLDNPDQNELNAQIGGMACSKKSTAEKSRPLAGMLVSQIYRDNFYNTLTASTLLSGMFGTLHTKDESGKYVGNGLFSLDLKTPPKVLYDANFEIKSFNKEKLFPCGAENEGEEVPQLDLPVKGQSVVQTGSEQPLNVVIPFENFDEAVKRAIEALLAFLKAGGDCLKNPKVCAEILQSLGTYTTLTIACPGCKAQNVMVNGGDDDLETVNPQGNKIKYKGWANTLWPAKINREILVNGTTQQEVKTTVFASSGQTTSKDLDLPWKEQKAAQEAIDKTRECLLMPAALQPSWCKTLANLTPGGWNCNTAANPPILSRLNVQGGHDYAQQLYNWCSSKDKNAWDLCYKDVIDRSQKARIDPIFALAIWLHESAASNYQCGHELTGSKIEDFGIHTAPEVPSEDFSKQLDYFLTLADRYAWCGKTLDNFIAMFWFGKCMRETTAEKRAKVATYISELTVIYSRIAPGQPLPTWPK